MRVEEKYKKLLAVTKLVISAYVNDEFISKTAWEKKVSMAMDQLISVDEEIN